MMDFGALQELKLAIFCKKTRSGFTEKLDFNHKIIQQKSITIGGGGDHYRRRVVSLATRLDLKAYRLAAAADGGGSGDQAAFGQS